MRSKQRKLRRRLRWIAIAVGLPVIVSLLLVLPLRWFNPITSAFMLQDDSGREPILHEWQAWPALRQSMPLAVVAAEDQRFAEHFGLDVQAIRKSFDDAERGRQLRGASTISQQLAKNLFLSPSRSMLRKGIEAWLTVVIEICLPKRRILEIYLNIVEFGPGIYGVGAASRHYFHKTADSLTDWEAALLAAVLPNPIRLRVDAPSSYLRKRQQWIIGQMQRLRRERWLTLLQ
ncbi:MAG: monofunctional biosynthetic peptidoglycan transglycosylase [Proteobacteria bacterium]|nr:monofunctional biosynthetic peptidoglycan transglycosylase [Pseudomonadota bacterium]MDA1062974.1 monofunctional biosynthetic peptidoglycan transglycosylase [Pseudomonadota bacterium]